LPAAWPEPPHTKQPTIGDEVSALEMNLYMRNQLLRDSDVMSMAWGLELRVPFVDQNLMSRLATIPARSRLQPGKKLLLEAVPEIPGWITGQPKRGFVLPFRKWLDSDWEELFRGATVKFGIRSRTWYQKWAIFVFEHWCRAHRVS
jgi:asparagine synthase (glutamine-hydrolysing)